MPYKRSRARKQFDSDVGKLLQDLRIAYSTECSSNAVRDLALCAAVVLCSARLESYLEDLLDGWGSAVQSQGLTTEKLSRRVRAFLLHQQALSAVYRRFLVDDDEGQLLSKIDDMIRQNRYHFAVDGQQLPRFAARTLYEDRKYPSPKNLNRLFHRFGFGNIFHELNRIARKDTEALLTSFNDLRTELAHVGLPVGLNVTDIKEKIRDVQQIVGWIDRVFYSYVCGSVGDHCWRV